MKKIIETAGIGKFMVTDRVVYAYLNSFIDLTYAYFNEECEPVFVPLPLNDCRNIQETARVLIENYEPESEWGESLAKVLRKVKVFVDGVIISNEPMSAENVKKFLEILGETNPTTSLGDYD